MKNKFTHNEDGTTHIFIETKNKKFPGKWTVIIDTEDWDKVKDYSWALINNGAGTDRYPYVYTSILHPDGGWRYRNYNGIRKRAGRKRTTLCLHHLIMGKPQKGMVIDHVNHNGFDNRKENLREITRAQNMRNMRSQKNSSSKYKGVGWCKSREKWISRIKHNRKTINLGYFSSEEDAALAYNKKAIELWGEEHVLLNEIK